MTSFLHIAARVEAAVQAYDSVRKLVDKDKWTAAFKEELSNTAQEFQRVKDETSGASPPVHPTLLALSIVLERDEDLGRINASHPDLQEHQFYDPNSKFAPCTPDLLPPNANRWWERLAEDARRENAQALPPTRAPFTVCKKLTLLVTEPEEKDSDLPMVLDEEPASHGRPSTVKAATATRKRKNSEGARVVAKRRGRPPKQRADAAEQSSGGSDANPAEQASENLSIKCQRCADAKVECIIVPNGPCKRCKSKKQGCSLMPVNPETGKTDRHARSPSQLMEYRRKQAEAPQAEVPAKNVKKGKKRVRSSPDAGEKEGSGLSPLANLESLALDSHGSSAANSPADSPAALNQAPLPGRPVGTSPSDPKTGDSSKRPAGFIAEVPGTSNLEPTHRQTSRSRGDTSLASDDGNNAARIAALEGRQDALERQMREFDVRLQKLGA